MGNLDFVEKESSQIEKKTKSKEQLSLEQNSWLKNNAQNLTSQDIYSLIQNYSLQNPKIQTETQKFKTKNSQALNLILAKEATHNEIKENPETTNKLNLFQNLTNNLKTSLIDIQKSLNDSTSLSLRSMDAVVGVFSDNNVFNTYASSFETTKSQAKQILTKLGEIDQNTLTPKQKELFNSLQKELNQILSLKLEKTGIVQMSVNEVKNIPQNLENGLYGVKGVAEGVVDGGISVITGSIDLAKFMVKYPLNSEYRDNINVQTEKIYNYLIENNLLSIGDKVYEALSKEMDRISKLPQKDQAEAIGNIGGNIISMLTVTKVGITLGEKLTKVSQAQNLISKAEIAGNTARAEKIRELSHILIASKRGLQGFDILLTGVAESALLKGLGTSYKTIKVVLEDISKTKAEKITIINEQTKNLKDLKGNNEENQILEKYIEELNSKKKEFFQKLTQNEIGSLDDNLRIEYAEFLLNKKIGEIKQKAILEAHYTGEVNLEGKFSIGDLRKKYIILKNAGFNDNEIRTLMEKGICGKEKNIDIKNSGLENSPDYSFLNNERYNELRKLYGGTFDKSLLIGEGVNGIILKHPFKNNRIIKIAKEGKSGENIDKLEDEYLNHRTFYLELEKLKSEYKGKTEEKYFDKFQIPEIGRFDNDKGIYEMEKINGQNLRTNFYLKYYKNELSDIPDNELYNLNDNQVLELIHSRNLKELPKSGKSEEKLYETEEGRDFIYAGEKHFDSFYWPSYGGILKPILNILARRKFYHNDEHMGNFMIDNDKNIYMIDFGRSKIPNNK